MIYQLHVYVPPRSFIQKPVICATEFFFGGGGGGLGKVPMQGGWCSRALVIILFIFKNGRMFENRYLLF